MSITSLTVGYILGVISTLIFTISLNKRNVRVENEIDEKAPKLSLLLGVFLIVPILAGLIYWKVGNPNAASMTSPSTMPSMNNVESTPIGNLHEIGDLAAMAEKLATKLKANPENAEGWALLAHTYVEIKQHQNAIAAFEKATQMISNDPQLLADYADALAVTNGGKFDSKTTDLVEKALKIDPNHPKALLLAGTIAFKNADYPKAISIWEHLKPLISKENTELMQDIANNIVEAKTLLKKNNQIRTR